MRGMCWERVGIRRRKLRPQRRHFRLEAAHLIVNRTDISPEFLFAFPRLFHIARVVGNWQMRAVVCGCLGSRRGREGRAVIAGVAMRRCMLGARLQGEARIRRAHAGRRRQLGRRKT